MKKTISKCIRAGLVSMTLVVSFLAITPVMAHIMTDTSQFPDVKSSEARFDILVLVGLGVIPETTTFEPLDMEDLISGKITFDELFKINVKWFEDWSTESMAIVSRYPSVD